MKRVILILSLCVVTAMAQAPTANRRKPSAADVAIDQQALTSLQRMADFLRTLKTFTITSESSREEIVDADMKVQKNGLNKISIRLPDRLHAFVHSDDHDLQFIYDGQTLTLYSGTNNYYATTPAPSP